MINRSVISFWTDKDRRMEAAHLLDLCKYALETTEVVITPFLIPGQSAWLRNVLRSIPVYSLAWGGFEDAERLKFVLASDKDQIRNELSQISLLQAVPVDKTVILEHRRILGSLMGLGLDRDVIGDIRQSERGAVVAVSDQITEYILQNWKSVGMYNIEVEICKEAVAVFPTAGVEKRIISASFRLDALVAGGFGISRSMAQEKIRNGDVQINGIISLKPDSEIQTGDTISCRGRGKFKILDLGGQTRKGKNVCKIFIFTDKKISP